MRQYLDVKSRYPDAIVFFRLGDFYEMFYEDATYVAKALSLTLTTRDKGKEDPVPMCGVPHHAVRSYVARLTELGGTFGADDAVLSVVADAVSVARNASVDQRGYGAPADAPMRRPYRVAVA